MNLESGGKAPTNARAAPDSTTAAQPASLPRPSCCIETARKIDTEVGGAIISGISVRNDATILPIAHVTVVATMDAVSS
jgi:hypothetical protein